MMVADATPTWTQPPGAYSCGQRSQWVHAMTGLASFKVERTFLYHAIAAECARRGLATDWWGVLSVERQRETLEKLGGPFSRVMSYADFMGLDGTPDQAEIE